MRRLYAIVGVWALFLVPGVYAACGIDWDLPDNPYENVNELGFVSYWEKIGEIQSGDASIPVNINFRSDRAGESYTLGDGWSLSLLDANVVQTDERTFLLYEPGGRFRLFWRDPKDPSILNGQGNWKAEVKGDTLTAWTACGTKLVYRQGRIASISVKGRTMDYVYAKNQIIGLTENGDFLLKVENDPATGSPKALNLKGGGRIEIDRIKRAKIKSIQSKDMITGFMESLGKLTFPDGKTRTFEYPVDERVLPAIKIPNGTTIEWNAASNLVSKEGDWIYDVKPSSDFMQPAAIERTNKNGLSEFWYQDTKAGKLTVRDINGKTTEKTYFTSGILRGLLRKVCITTGGKSEEIYSASYDEKGRSIREVDNGLETRYLYDGSSVQTLKNGVVASIETKSADGNREIRYPDGTCVVLLDRDNGGQFFNLLGEIPDSFRNQVVRCDLIVKGNFRHIRYFDSNYVIIAEKLPEMIISGDRIIFKTPSTPPNYP